MNKRPGRPQRSSRRIIGIDASDPDLPVAGRGSLSKVRRSTRGRWRAAVLALVHLAIVLHATDFLIRGRTLSPVEPSESMYTIELGQLNAGFVFFALALLSTLLFGRFFCGWGCHLVALQDLCGWTMKKLGVRPRAFRSRFLVYVPLFWALYMFVWPSFKRAVLLPVLDRLESDVAGWFTPVAPFPGFSNHLVTTEFWDTFPGPLFSGLTFLVCGFAAVYVLGAKGFCTYGCPYGAFFGALDKFAPGRILVTDACDQCGHCTATCTSNVRVHEEVKHYGKVVNPGCMKCTDCVSVCPRGALYFGFSRPAAFSPAPSDGPRRRSYTFSVGEELALLVVCGAAIYAFRGLYDGPPLLMSVGLGGISAYIALCLWRLWRDPSVRLQNLRLKTEGRLRTSGRIFAGLAIGWLLFTAHSAFVQGHRDRGRQYLDRTEVSREDLLNGSYRSRRESPTHQSAAAQAMRHFELADRWGLVGVVEIKLGLAWLHMIADEPAQAEHYLDAASALAPDSPQQYANRSEFLLWQGRLPEAIDTLQRRIQLDSGTVSDRFRLATVLAQSGRYEEAVEQYRIVLERSPDFSAARYNLGGLLRRMGRHDEAVEQLGLARDLAPSDAETRVELGLALVAAGRTENAIVELRRAIELAPDRPESRFYLEGLVQQLEAESRGGGDSVGGD